MKQIIENRYLKGFQFSTPGEALVFFNNQKTNNRLFITETLGENNYCYVCFHSLTQECEFVLSFKSDENEDKLNFLFWANTFLLDTGKSIYLIDEDLKIKKAFEITSPLIGLYLINEDKLLLLEEAYMRIVDREGKLLKGELFDLVEDFSINANLLFIRTSEETRSIELT